MGFIERDGKIGKGLHKINKYLLIGEGIAVVATAALGLFGIAWAAALHPVAVTGFAGDAATTPAVEQTLFKKSKKI